MPRLGETHLIFLLNLSDETVPVTKILYIRRVFRKRFEKARSWGSIEFSIQQYDSRLFRNLPT